MSEHAHPFRGILGYDVPGMTLREHYAGLAMQGLLASGATREMLWLELVRGAVAFADALIAELAKKPDASADADQP